MNHRSVSLFCGIALATTISVSAVDFQAPDLKINTTPSGSSYNGGCIVCDDTGTVYSFYNSSRSSADPTQEANALEVYANVSLDHGLTWFPADIRIDSGPGVAGTPDRLRVWSPFLGCDDLGHFYAGWMDGRDFNDPARGIHPGTGWWEDGRCNRTLDRGATWLMGDRRINTWNGNYPRCSMPVSANDQQGHVYVVWYSTLEQPTCYNQIRCTTSSDHGATWGADVRLDSAPALGTSEWYPQVACDEDGHVYAAWESSGRRQVRFNCSHDHGTTWQAADLRVDTDPTGLGKTAVALACDQSGHVYATWKDYRDAGGPGAAGSIYINRSADHGATWEQDRRVDAMGVPPAAGPEYGPQIACTEDGVVYLAWEDKRNGNEWDIFFTRSTDFGETWESDRRLDTDLAGAYRSFRPQLRADDLGGVYVVWEDWRAGYHHIYMNYSLDQGATWQSEDFRVDTDPAVAHAEWPRLCVTGSGVVYVAWGFHRPEWVGDCSDIHFNAYVPPASTSPLPTVEMENRLDCSPNPLMIGARMQILCSLGESLSASFAVHDIAGRRVRLIRPIHNLVPGMNRVTWDGRGDDGLELGAGVYFLRVRGGSTDWARRVVILK